MLCVQLGQISRICVMNKASRSTRGIRKGRSFSSGQILRHQLWMDGGQTDKICKGNEKCFLIRGDRFHEQRRMEKSFICFSCFCCQPQRHSPATPPLTHSSLARLDFSLPVAWSSLDVPVAIFNLLWPFLINNRISWQLCHLFLSAAPHSPLLLL